MCLSWPRPNKRSVKKLDQLPALRQEETLLRNLDKNCFFCSKKYPVEKTRLPAVWFFWFSDWKSLFKLPINQTQALTYTSLCPWGFIALLCGLCFPSQTFVVSYSSHPVPLIGQSKLLVGPFFTTSRSTLFYKRIFSFLAASRRLWEGGSLSEVQCL